MTFDLQVKFRSQTYFGYLKQTVFRSLELIALLMAMSAHASDWVFVSEYVGGKIYVHRPSIERRTVFVHALEKHVLNPPTPNRLSGKLIREMLLWNEYDTASSLFRTNHMALKYVDGTKDDLAVVEPEWNPAERASGEMLRFLNKRPHQ